VWNEGCVLSFIIESLEKFIFVDLDSDFWVWFWIGRRNHGNLF
jgi:hypothetical protein